MSNDYFIIIGEGRDIEFGREIALDIDRCKFHLWKSNDFDVDEYDLGEESIGLFVEVVAKKKEIECFDEKTQKAFKQTIDTCIYTEWLDAPISSIKNKDFRSLNNMVVNFDDSQEIYEINEKPWESYNAPGAVYLFSSHRPFYKVKIEFKYLGQARFNVKLVGIDEFETPFIVSVDVPLEVSLTAYDKKASKEDILGFFNRVFNSEDFSLNWEFKDDDIFFIAKPKESESD